MTTLDLTPFEILHAAQVGIARNVSALRDHRPLENGRTDLGMERHIIGAIGEYAVSRALDCCWRPAVGRLDTLTGDVGRVQVKATTLPNGCLIVREHDPAEFTYVLAIVRLARTGLGVLLPGSVAGHVAKQPEFWSLRGHQPGYYVPQSRLEPLPLREANPCPFP